MECRCDELRDKIRNMVITFRNDSNDAIAEINRLSTQLAEAAKAAEEMELALQKASDEFRKQLAERDAETRRLSRLLEIIRAGDVLDRAEKAEQENAALRAEVERLKLIISGKTFVDERKLAAQECTALIVGSPWDTLDCWCEKDYVCTKCRVGLKFGLEE